MARRKRLTPLTVQPIFTRDHYELLKGAQRMLHDLLPKLDAMDACGMECAQHRALAVEIGERLNQIEQHFMTPAPE